MDKNKLIEELFQELEKIFEVAQKKAKYNIGYYFIIIANDIYRRRTILPRLKTGFEAILNAENMVNTGDSGHMEDK